MKNLRMMLFLSLIWGLSSCANQEDKLEEGQVASEDFLDDGNDEDLMVEDKGDSENEVGDVELADAQEEMENAISTTGDIGTYVTSKGETLMQVAFKIYGDYRQWKQIMQLNNLSNPNVSVGTSLKYSKPAKEFVWNPSGKPYLVKRGDTLGFISQEKYNTSKRWRDIYNNNRPLIRDPDRIFAGFTLYYIPDQNRQNATSE